MVGVCGLGSVTQYTSMRMYQTSKFYFARQDFGPEMSMRPAVLESPCTIAKNKYMKINSLATGESDLYLIILAISPIDT